MKSKLMLLEIFLYTAISRFFLIGKIPAILDSSIIHLRIASATLSLVSTILLFYLIKNYWRSTRVALLSSWAFSVLPWVFEQGRIVSQPNYALFSILLFIAFTKSYLYSFTSGEYFAHPRGVFRAFLYVFITIILIFVYPRFWLFKIQEFKFSINSLITNLFILSSFDFLFFKNITFWWGGVREFGMIFLSMLPFFLVGVYELFIRKKGKLLFLLGLITFIAALSPFFPESREFYFAMPIVSIIIAVGLDKLVRIYKFSLPPQRWILVTLIFSFILYEMTQFFHFYFVHYPQQILGNFSQIHEAF